MADITAPPAAAPDTTSPLLTPHERLRAVSIGMGQGTVIMIDRDFVQGLLGEHRRVSAAIARRAEYLAAGAAIQTRAEAALREVWVVWLLVVILVGTPVVIAALRVLAGWVR